MSKMRPAFAIAMLAVAIHFAVAQPSKIGGGHRHAAAQRRQRRGMGMGMGEGMGKGMGMGMGKGSATPPPTSPPISTSGRSDMRLKENMKRAGTSPAGIPLWSWTYRAGNSYDPEVTFCGTMAQDLLNTRWVDAVGTFGPSNFYNVDYSKLPDVLFGPCNSMKDQLRI